jgi:prephenate dehydrogenase/predicted amino acid-binding ACT domain protein
MKNPLEKSLTVIGGGNGWGQKIALTAQAHGAPVHIVEKDTSANDRDDMIAKSEVIFLAPTDSEIPQILESIRDQLSGKMLLDCATNKSRFEGQLTAIAQDVSTCSTHPMVVSTAALRGQNALIMPIGPLAEPASLWAQNLFSSMGMLIKQIPFEEHHRRVSLGSQFIPHLIQRTAIGAMQRILSEMDLSLEDINAIAPANAKLTAMAMGRVAMQRPDVSAGIFDEGIHSEIGAQIVNIFIATLVEIAHQARISREATAALLEEHLKKLDPKGVWTAEMKDLSGQILESMANLKECSMKITAQQDRPGILLAITSVFARHHINMTALLSNRVERPDGTASVELNIGVNASMDQLNTVLSELDALGFQVAMSR